MTFLKSFSGISSLECDQHYMGHMYIVLRNKLLQAQSELDLVQFELEVVKSCVTLVELLNAIMELPEEV